MFKHLNKVAAASAAAAIIVFALTGAASAHVSPVEPTAPADGYTTVELQIPHGCEGAATERLEVQLNEQISSVKAEAVPGWTVSYEREPLSEPIELYGEEVTEYVSVVTWTADADPLPDDQYLRFGISMKMPDAPGESLRFPTVQHCVGGGTSSWIEEDPDGEHPAPAVELTATESGHGTDGEAVDDSDTSAAEETTGAPATATTTDSSNGSGTLALVLSVAAVALASAAVVLALRRRTA